MNHLTIIIEMGLRAEAALTKARLRNWYEQAENRKLKVELKELRAQLETERAAAKRELVQALAAKMHAGSEASRLTEEVERLSMLLRLRPVVRKAEASS